MGIKVCKFGGSSVANSEQIKKVAEIILQDKKRKIIVVSAPGKINKNEEKITDLLIKCANDYLQKNTISFCVDQIKERFLNICLGLNIDTKLAYEAENDLIKRLKTFFVDEKKYLDSIKALGEEYSAKILADYLNNLGHKCKFVDPREVGLLVDENFGNANILESSYIALSCLKGIEEIVVFPGFYGYTQKGEIATFSRGGSDLTGSILANVVDAELYENFTDVDGLFAVDPYIIKNPVQIKEITYRELRELSCAGFTVFHDEAMYPVMKKNIPVEIKNTNNSFYEGTFVVPDRKLESGKIVGIACSKGFCSINVEKYLMNKEKGFGRKLLQILEEKNLSYEHTPSGVDNISVVLKQKQISKELFEEIKKEIFEKLNPDTVSLEHNIALISVVGEGMKHIPGMAFRATYNLAKVKVNIEMISQGASEISMIFGIKENDAEMAVNALYKAFFE
ncbi:MAG: aspartate kinase [bacterium]